ncbi:very short patch repair endonuclease [Paenibacillus elgii]|uniref:very short patch repair endonuclease n=1 Tax=Paenibacillus elgii TaxID=189691 RepID=UPI002D7B126A|nr:very short patch repair endonuclease [Paenibacillus elgii]
MDKYSKEKRHEIMSKVKSKNTDLEIKLRKILHKLKYRFRLHRKDLPGNPDIVLPKHKKVIFVHGCFWHGHHCKKGNLPKSNLEYWQPKIVANKERDKRNIEKLKEMGWNVLTVWGCEIKEISVLEEKLTSFLKN